MKKCVCFIIMFMFAICVCGHGMGSSTNNDSVVGRLMSFCRNMSVYDKLYGQEKVYLHLDNNGYLPGENIWFKAYVFKASTLLPTDMSKVLYVELLNPNGQIMERKTLPVLNGRTYGCFSPDPLLMQSGYYEVRAYTRAMLNWDEGYIYSRVFPVFEVNKDTVDFSDLSIDERFYEKKTLGYNRTVPKPMFDGHEVRVGKCVMSFYPEGGNIVAGLPSRVAYKLTDRDGLPLSGCSVEVFDKDNTPAARSAVVHEGMGLFDLSAGWRGGYAVVKYDDKKFRFELPEVLAEGCVARFEGERDGNHVFSIASTSSFVGRTIGVSATCRGRLCYFDTLTLADVNEVKISSLQLGEGVNQVTFFGDNGEIYCDRMVWNAPREASPVMTIRQNAESYGAFAPVVLDVDLKDAEGNPLQGDFSLSVRDAATEVAPDACGLATDMLLCSDLKGYVHNPDFYFSSTDSLRSSALDLLLMVQGWRRYAWREMAGVDTLNVKQPIEEGLLFMGRVSNVKKPSADNRYNVNFVLQTDKGMEMFSTKSESDGRIAFLMPDFSDDVFSVITLTDAKDRRVECDLSVDRNFYPPRRCYEPAEIRMEHRLDQLRSQVSAFQPKTFEWADTIPDLISKLVKLGEVNIKAKRISSYSGKMMIPWSGGENAFKNSCAYFYDLVEELDHYKDKNNSTPNNVWEWLASVNPNVDYIPGDEEVYYRGRLVYKIALDNKEAWGRNDINTSSLMEDLKSLAIVEDVAAVADLTSGVFAYSNKSGSFKTSPRGNYSEVTFALYRDEVEKSLPKYKRGTRWITLHGYSRCEEFYSPDYRQFDVPSAEDHRRTLYWNPSLMTDKNGRATVSFYSNSRPKQTLRFNAQGIGVNGRMFEAK